MSSFFPTGVQSPVPFIRTMAYPFLGFFFIGSAVGYVLGMAWAHEMVRGSLSILAVVLPAEYLVVLIYFLFGAGCLAIAAAEHEKRISESASKSDKP